MNHAESPKVCEKVLKFFTLISPIIVKFSEICRKTPFLRSCDELFTAWSLLFQILPFLGKDLDICRHELNFFNKYLFFGLKTEEFEKEVTIK